MSTPTITNVLKVPAGDHAYLKTRRISGEVLRFQVAFEEARLHEVAERSTAGRAGKTLVKEDTLRVVLMALQKGTELPWHDVGGAMSLQLLRGRLRMTTADGKMDLAPGALIVLNGRVQHSSVAMSDCVMLMTIAMQEPASG